MLEGRPARQPETGNHGPVVRRTAFDRTGRLSTNILLILDSFSECNAESSEATLSVSIDADGLDTLFRSLSDGDRAEGWVCLPLAEYGIMAAQEAIVVRTGACG